MKRVKKAAILPEEFRILYNDKEQMLMSLYDVPVSPKAFYDDLFPAGSFQREEHYNDPKPNGIALDIKEKKDGSKDIERSFIHEGNEKIKQLQNHRDVIISAVGYYGKARTNRNSSKLYAFVFDIDGVGMDQIQNLHHFTHELKKGANYLPPTYIVNSGGGVHLYFVLKEPITLQPKNLAKCNQLKKALLPIYWNKKMSTDPNPQYQGVTQGFRMVGSKTSQSDKHTITAYRSGEKVTLEELQEGLYTDDRKDKYYQALKVQTPLIEAAERWPEWHQRRIIEGQPRNPWKVKAALYEWWLRKIKDEDPITGHRYFRIMCLAVYAAKCEIPPEKLENDALDLISIFDKDENNAFTEDDIFAALQAYDPKYKTFPRRTIEVVASIDIPPNKRNRLSRQENLEIARFSQSVKYRKKGTDWRNKNGRPKGTTYAEKVQAYLQEHPGETNKSKIARELKITRQTVAKYFDIINK